MGGGAAIRELARIHRLLSRVGEARRMWIRANSIAEDQDWAAAASAISC